MTRPSHVLVFLAVVLVGGCTIASVETPDPAAVPSGPLGVPPDATGPAVELGSGQAEGLGWRLAIAPSGNDWCTELEVAGTALGGCGDLLPQGDAAFGSVGSTDMGPNGTQVVEGIAAERVVTVWLVENDTQRRFPATLMPLDPAGVDGVAFVGFVPADMEVTHLLAVAMSGEILDTYELP